MEFKLLSIPYTTSDDIPTYERQYIRTIRRLYIGLEPHILQYWQIKYIVNIDWFTQRLLNLTGATQLSTTFVNYAITQLLVCNICEYRRSHSTALIKRDEFASNPFYSRTINMLDELGIESHTISSWREHYRSAIMFIDSKGDRSWWDNYTGNITMKILVAMVDETTEHYGKEVQDLRPEINNGPIMMYCGHIYSWKFFCRHDDIVLYIQYVIGIRKWMEHFIIHNHVPLLRGMSTRLIEMSIEPNVDIIAVMEPVYTMEIILSNMGFDKFNEYEGEQVCDGMGTWWYNSKHGIVHNDDDVYVRRTALDDAMFMPITSKGEDAVSVI